MPDQPPETLFTGRHHIRLEEVPSTNTFALDLVRSTPVTEGTVVSAQHQTAGRGQRGNDWQSAPGENLTVSIVLRPVFLAPAAQFDLTRAVALAVAETVENACKSAEVKISVKWPNDIYINQRKVAGILVENILGNNRFVAAVTGIGLNVNQIQFGVLGNKATSLRLVTGTQFDNDLLLGQLCSYLEKYYLMLRAGKTDELRTLYESKLYLRGTESGYSEKGLLFRGTLTGTSAEGLLQITTAAGEERSFSFKEVVFEG
ncbi:MAG: biotin--[acetyl-CoA-carboxylase] ligase [Bacteroidia bacterium]|jgi:BirA family biotin operon repressor/biotin-[acetyl-CoA-carboxylase] ligase|nr:biotin--[acetyl-CoA-carboxylase] ligase [Bacteroidia bacterium]